VRNGFCGICAEEGRGEERGASDTADAEWNAVIIIFDIGSTSNNEKQCAAATTNNNAQQQQQQTTMRSSNNNNNGDSRTN